MRIWPSQSTRHEAEGRIDGLVDDREVQPVALGDRLPVVDPGAAERIDAHADLRAANGVHVDHVGEIADVSVEVVVPVRRGGAQSLLEGQSSSRPAGAFSRNSLAFASIQAVTPVVRRARRWAGCT